MGMLFTGFVLILGLGPAVFGVRALTGLMALAPLLFVLGSVLNIVVELRADATSHNLWPFKCSAS